ncbi:HNH endonuclease, putative [Mycobacteroides abscessus subsp. abscessus]|uniref:HNH endonuclease n=1 Tax=Mycobacteroides abscessus TaxID=36809 RepID=UPI00092BE253|nr:HNH endonuclease [Mycobacteroides abscessus]SHY11634.1 HNH endonuclease, putative [Mycobacteroides abscessus subsp. abscessus]SID55457.1 HNH endonuclease, putative [Mycobacteroides abscessus subsp. abscessus]SKO44141.1 HNH endonuclease, putative [Mycobacteroides abscessus subsp. abscessus]
MAVTKRLRYEVLRRDNYSCRYCGRSAPEVKLTVDHVVPVALGGSDEPSNLVAACSDCNAGKSSVPADAALISDVSSDAIRWAMAIQEAVTRMEAERREIHIWFRQVWFTAADGLLVARNRSGGLITSTGSSDMYTNAFHYTELHLLEAPKRPANHIDSVMTFMAAGLDRPTLERLARTAMQSNVRRDDKWKYFCGCCWKQIGRIQALAGDILRNEEVPN